MLTQARLKKLLYYDPVLGWFMWLDDRCGRVKPGQAAGTSQKKGYLHIEIDGAGYKVHRLAWFYIKGKWPKDQIDHYGNNKINNCWKNLREATNQTNHQNRRHALSTNFTGVLGVGAKPSGGRFSARITVNKKTISLGKFDTAEQAYVEYVTAKRKLHVGCTL